MEIFDEQIPLFGQADYRTLNQIRVCARSADKVALMPDNQVGYGVRIGGVVAYKNAISPTGVGYDIGCGNKAVRVDMPGTELRARIARIMDDVWSIISFGVGRRNNERVDHALFDDVAWKVKAISSLKERWRVTCSSAPWAAAITMLICSRTKRISCGLVCTSAFIPRGLGHKNCYRTFLKAAGASDGMDVEPCVLSTDSDLGAEYLEAMRLAGDYAYAGRDWVCGRVAKILGSPIVEEVHNHHNYAWREEHEGEQLWVVRKGATPAFPGQRGFVGGTMGEQSVILEGVENEHARYSLYSTVHGAGRAMGRREATGVVDRKTGEVKRAGKVTPEMMRAWVDRAGIELRGAGLDESPDCYKRLDEVLESVGDTVRILHRLTPVGVAMAGANEFDPYKD